MMNGQNSPKEWEELSAFLDEQLSTKEKEHLETRLKNSPHLQSDLNELKELRALLRAQPVIRAPRNYLLSADMEGVQIKRRKIGFVFPALSFAAVVTSFLFVFLFVSDLTYRGSQVTQLMNVSEEKLEPQLMEKALPERAASEAESGEIGEAQAVPLEPAEEDLEIMKEIPEGSESSQLETFAVEPEPRVDSQVSERGENRQRITPNLVQNLVSNRKAFWLLEFILVVAAFSAGFGAFYIYRKSG